MTFIYEKEGFEKLFKETSIIVIGTNVLLDIYSLTPKTIEDIVDSFESNLKLFGYIITYI